MALYTQDISKVSLPVVIHVHGGGWKRGDRSIAFYGAPYMGAGYARNGFISVTVSYRLATKTQQHPAQIEVLSSVSPYPPHFSYKDVARAIQWVFEHCHQFGGDKTKIFISGHSAGAHLASLVTVSPLYLKHLGVSVIKVFLYIFYFFRTYLRSLRE
jgi:carboxylesterase type B